jgi:hypothetical protein
MDQSYSGNQTILASPDWPLGQQTLGWGKMGLFRVVKPRTGRLSVRSESHSRKLLKTSPIAGFGEGNGGKAESRLSQGVTGEVHKAD